MGILFESAASVSRVPISGAEYPSTEPLLFFRLSSKSGEDAL